MADGISAELLWGVWYHRCGRCRQQEGIQRRRWITFGVGPTNGSVLLKWMRAAEPMIGQAVDNSSTHIFAWRSQGWWPPYIPFHSIPFHSIPFHSIPFHSIRFHTIPTTSPLYHVSWPSMQANVLTLAQGTPAEFHVRRPESFRHWETCGNVRNPIINHHNIHIYIYIYI